MVTNFPKRYLRLALTGTLALALFLLHCSFQVQRPGRLQIPDIPYPVPSNSSSELPPLFHNYRSYEDAVSVWNIINHGKPNDSYLYFDNHAYGAGWGNIMQEMIFSSVLVSLSGRGFVWDDYTWNKDGSQYSQYNGKRIPSKVPLSTMIGGHILGLPMSPSLPPSISRRIYEQICPESDRLYLDNKLVKNHIGLPEASNALESTMSAKQVLDAWLSLLNSPAVRDKKCVQVTGPQIFDIWMNHTPRIHSLVETLLNSPVLTNWGWSQLVKGVFEKNIQFFVSAPFKSRFSDTKATSRLPLIVLHLRRGDYEDHCHQLVKYRSVYVGLPTLPEFEQRDSFNVPTASTEEETTAFYLKHCYPNATQITQRVREVLHDYETFLESEHKTRAWWRRWPSGLKPLAGEKIKKVYIMSNGKRDWLDDVKKELLEDAERSRTTREDEDQWRFDWVWEGVASSRDLDAGWEEKHVLQVMDMVVGQRAELFIGNGFSTMTSNLVMLRKSDGFHPIQTRFW